MKTVVGILNSREEAAALADRLKDTRRKIEVSILSPGATPEELAQIPTSDTEQPGMGAAMGAVVGGALGAAGGMGLGVTAAMLFVPVAGPVLAIGMAGAAMLAAGGALGCALAGDALEDSMSKGLPIDELFIYEDALKHGRSVLIAMVEDDEEANRVREIMSNAGTEAVDAAREHWWIGLRDDERVHYSKQLRDFETEEPVYREGFEAAQHPSVRGASYDEALDRLKKRSPDHCLKDSFRCGYERGVSYYRDLARAEKGSIEAAKDKSSPPAREAQRTVAGGESRKA